ncbi:rhophilin-1 isoform X2 [Syngnathus typhle]|uniref:rhophilin-1 isoform X2 n=1 Tax=Syngnathus typhle TaxID=161592 RepID=UPI002A6A15D8|nr:rhophilin-1 isoform X2 [Syngnathus typhle]
MEEHHTTRQPDSSSNEDVVSLRSPGEDNSCNGSIRKGCDPYGQSQRSKLQNQRARINQQINKEMRMRAGAENLFRATTNNKIKETVALELTYVNSNLQLLKEELEDLNSNMEVYQTDSEAVNVPLIPLGLKETKEVDFSTPIQDFIHEYYGEDGLLYQKEIKELMDLRQAMRTPARNQTGLGLLMEYYNQLYFLDRRFLAPHENLGVHFHWYDSLTGVPSCQRALAFEKGSVLFNIGALYTQIGARQDRSASAGIERAIDAFHRAAGAFDYLKENFSNAPSLDMSGPALCMLVRLMVAQAQECAFERVALGPRDADLVSSLRLAQEAAQVSDVYLLARGAMSQPPMKNYVPCSWASLVQVKSEHFRALSHYFAAVALCDRMASEDTAEAEKTLLHFYVSPCARPPLGQLLGDAQQRRKFGKAHLRHAVMRHEEAIRLHGVCKILRKIDTLQDVLVLAHKRSLDKYSELEREDDFEPTLEAPHIRPQSQQEPDMTLPHFVPVADLFQRLAAGGRRAPFACPGAKVDSALCSEETRQSWWLAWRPEAVRRLRKGPLSAVAKRTPAVGRRCVSPKSRVRPPYSTGTGRRGKANRLGTDWGVPSTCLSETLATPRPRPETRPQSSRSGTRGGRVEYSELAFSSLSWGCSSRKRTAQILMRIILKTLQQMRSIESIYKCFQLHRLLS